MFYLGLFTFFFFFFNTFFSIKITLPLNDCSLSNLVTTCVHEVQKVFQVLCFSNDDKNRSISMLNCDKNAMFEYHSLSPKYVAAVTLQL